MRSLECNYTNREISRIEVYVTVKLLDLNPEVIYLKHPMVSRGLSGEIPVKGTDHQLVSLKRLSESLRYDGEITVTGHIKSRSTLKVR